MATTQELATQLDELNAAIASGTTSVTYSTPNGASRAVTYRSLGEMLKVRADIQRQQGAAPERIRRGRLTFGRGL